MSGRRPRANGPSGSEGASADTPDARLVSRFLRHRDEDAFRELYRRHTPVLYRYALQRLRRPQAAESVVQETWLRAARGMDRFDGRSTLRSWLVGITRNCCREHARAGARLRLVPELGAEPTDPPPTTTRLDLEDAVERLPERARAVLLLHDVEGCTHAEIGQILEIDPGTSKSQLSRARRLVRRWLSGGDDHEFA